jgi:hypothetical protein
LIPKAADAASGPPVYSREIVPLQKALSLTKGKWKSLISPVATG